MFRISALLVAFSLAGTSPVFGGDAFDRHLSEHLQKVAKGKPIPKFSLEMGGKLKTISPDISSPCIVVRTNDGNLAKVLVGWGFRRGAGKLIPVALIERFVTYRADRNDTAAASGKDVMLFAGFAYNFDIGQVVPDGQGGDVRLNEKGELEPVGKAEIFGVDGSQLPPPKNGMEPEAQDGVVPRDFAGSWNITVDGRWNGELQLSVDRGGKLTGKYTSAESKSTYDLTGRVGALAHNVKLTIQLDNAAQTIDAFLFTRDKKTLTGISTLAGRKFGFLGERAKK